MIKRWTAAIMISSGIILSAQSQCPDRPRPDSRTLEAGRPLPDHIRGQLCAEGWDEHADDELALWVSAARQQLVGIKRGQVEFIYPCSTAAKGLGNQANSYQTPTGWHKIDKRIGDDAPWGTIFVERRPTGKTWTPNEPTEKDYVLSRILWLRGLEPGVNAGPGVDSYERYIYIHGTPAESALGRPASLGCVRLSNDNVIELYDRVKLGTLVLITPF